ncbi:MAG: biotin--[Bacteroidales bacterium]|nr:biotin--[acetyl-CoA-carboxylase] ligase [Bacteroidales bacterium]
MKPFNIIKLSEIPSTQTFLLQEDERKVFDEYTVVYTNNQTHGRGQEKHIWESEKEKNVLFSLLLKPTFLDPSNQFLITQMISLAIVDTLQSYGLEDVKIKWPNDIYVKYAKICGVLVQNKITGLEFSNSYIGIGINVNQKKFLFAPNPTSMFLETGKETDLDIFLSDVLHNIYKRYLQLKEDELERLQSEYLSLLLFKEERRKYIYKGKEIEAKILGVNRFGHLILESDDTVVIQCELRELQFIL